MWMQLIFHTLRLSLLFLLVAAHQYLGPRTKQLCSKYKISSQIIIVNIFPSRRNQLRSHPLLVERLWLWMERSCSRFLRMRSRSVRWRKRWIIVNHSFLQILSFQIVLVDLFCERHIHPHNYTCSMGLTHTCWYRHPGKWSGRHTDASPRNQTGGRDGSCRLVFVDWTQLWLWWK